jgi:hypothetical protein
VKRLNEYGMAVEIHPEFSFKTKTGFLPFKFRLANPPIETLNDAELISGFELYISDFNLSTAKQALKPKLSFFDRLFGKRATDVPFADPEVERRLSECKQIISFIWHSSDSFELRFASLTSAILTELTNGVYSYPADNIWYDNKNIVEEVFAEIEEYEKSLKPKNIKYQEFVEW